MSDERSPAFRFYVRDFFMDRNVVPMEDDEVGVYVRLLGIAWLEGSIPAEPVDIHGLLPRTKRRDFDRMWKKLSRCFDAHPSEPGRLVQGRLEREREKQRENRDRRTRAAQIGAEAARRKRQASGQQPDTDSESNRSPIDDRPESLAFASSFALASSETTASQSRAREGDESVLGDDEMDLGPPRRPVAVGPALAFATWFVTAALDAGALPPHLRLQLADVAYREAPAAESLVASYPRTELERRSRLLFERKLDRTDPMRKGCSIKTLVQTWDWFELKNAPADLRPAGVAVPDRSIDNAEDISATW